MDHCTFVLEVLSAHCVVTVDPVYFTVLISNRKLLVLYLVLVIVVAATVDTVVL
jgi:hypothetical protein